MADDLWFIFQQDIMILMCNSCNCMFTNVTISIRLDADNDEADAGADVSFPFLFAGSRSAMMTPVNRSPGYPRTHVRGLRDNPSSSELNGQCVVDLFTGRKYLLELLSLEAYKT